MRFLAILFALCFLVTPAFADYADPHSTIRLWLFKDGGDKIAGYGSGTYVGNKKILTAAHVLGFNRDRAPLYYDIRFGWDQKTYPAHIVWVDVENDLALISFEEDLDIVPIPISCEVPAVGTELRADGYPLLLGKVATWGKVSGEPRAFGPWAAINIITMPTVVMGQSGAGVSDSEGKLRGVLVGIPGMAAPYGQGEAFALGLVFMVSGKSICEAMNRNERKLSE